MHRIHIVAWRDRDDPEAGGSEEHASQLAKHWAEAGIAVTIHTSTAAGHPPTAERDGYSVVRYGGRFTVFPRTIVREISGRAGPRDGLVDVFHGAAFFSPLWARGPRVGFVHHVHLGAWHLLMPPGLAQVGHLLERFAIPVVYRRATLVTPSESTRTEVIERMHLGHADIRVAPNGVDPRFRPGGRRSPTPLVLAAGRLMPQKGFDTVLRALAVAHEHHPELRVAVVGDGPSRQDLERLAADLDMSGWLEFRGRASDQGLVEAYQEAWLVANASLLEGWGMTLTEAGACGTPAVASRIPGHTEAVDDGKSGVLVEGEEEMAAAIGKLLDDPARREQLGAGAQRHAARFTWAASAETVLRALIDDRTRRRR